MMTSRKLCVTALGGGNEIGASCYLLTSREGNVLLDAGLRPRQNDNIPGFHKMFDLLNDWSSVRAVLISHPHLDHVGSLPLVIEENPNIKIFVPPNCKRLVSVQILESLTIKEKDLKYSEDYPGHLYSVAQSQACINSMEEQPFFRQFKIPRTNIFGEFWPAGHILGSGSILLSSSSWKVLYSGDISTYWRPNIPLLKYKNVKVDLAILESTYLASRVNEDPSDSFMKMYARCKEIIANHGIVLIPSFALGKAQDILGRFIEKNRTVKDPVNVWVDGLVKRITEIYEEEVPGLHLFGKHINKIPRDTWNLNQFLSRISGSVIIASSGMMFPNTKSAIWAEQLCGDPRNAIFLTGYLDEESPGKKLLGMHKNDKIEVNDKKITVLSDIERFYLSTHAPQRGLVESIQKLTPDNVILVHGSFSPPDMDTFHKHAEIACGKTINIMRGENYITNEIDV